MRVRLTRRPEILILLHHQHFPQLAAWSFVEKSKNCGQESLVGLWCSRRDKKLNWKRFSVRWNFFSVIKFFQKCLILLSFIRFAAESLTISTSSHSKFEINYDTFASFIRKVIHSDISLLLIDIHVEINLRKPPAGTCMESWWTWTWCAAIFT